MEFVFSVAVFGFIVLLLARIVMQMQVIDVKEGRSAKAFFKWVCEDKNSYQGETVTRKELVTIFLLAIIFRLVVYGISAVYYCILSNETNFTIKTVLTLWNRWDSAHYLRLAELGYDNYVESGVTGIQRLFRG